MDRRRGGRGRQDVGRATAIKCQKEATAGPCSQIAMCLSTTGQVPDPLQPDPAGEGSSFRHPRSFAGSQQTALRIGLPSVARCRCQAPYDRPQHGLPNCFSCFFNREPFHLTLPPFRPLFPLSLYPQRVDVHFTDHNAAVLKALFVWKRSNGTSADRSNNTGFFKSFARSRMMRRFPLLGPALRNYPALCPS